jgi:hypothetical protein
MWTQAVVVRTAAREVDRGGNIPIAAAIATATAARANSPGGRIHDERGGNPNHIAFDRRPRWLLDEVFEGKRARRLSAILQPEILDL